MSTYPGILIRTNTSDVGNMPRSQDNCSGCPDIIPWQNVPIVDPLATFGNDTSYGQNPGKDILYNNTNYIYVRGKNLTGSANQGNVYLCYQPSNVVNWPVQWQQSNFLGGAVNPDPRKAFMPISTGPNGPTGYGCTGAFVWLNPNLPPAGAHYCLIAQCTAAGVTLDDLEAGWANITTSSGLAAWLATTGGVGWRNVALVDQNAPTFSTWATLTNGAQPGTYQAQLICQNLPAGSEVAFSSPTSNPGGIPIQLGKTTIPGTPGTIVPTFNASITTAMNANWSGTVYMQFYSNGYAYNPGQLQMTGLSFQFALQKTVQSLDSMPELYNIKGQTLAERGGLGENWVYYHPEHGHMTAAQALGPRGPYNFGLTGGPHGGDTVELFTMGSITASPRPKSQLSAETLQAP